MLSRISQWILTVMRGAQAGQGLVEYGLLVTLISIVSILIMAILGENVTSLYSQASTAFP